MKIIDLSIIFNSKLGKTLTNKQGWKLGREITVKKGNPNLFIALVDLKASGAPDIWIYEYDDFAGCVANQFKAYISKPKKDGSKRIDPNFRWYDIRNISEYDHAKRNAWNLITEQLK